MSSHSASETSSLAMCMPPFSNRPYTWATKNLAHFVRGSKYHALRFCLSDRGQLDQYHPDQERQQHIPPAITHRPLAPFLDTASPPVVRFSGRGRRERR